MIPDISEQFAASQLYASAAAIGAFDGIHLGHQHILKATVDFARKHGLTSVAILFDPLPSQFFGIISPNHRILLRNEQEEMLQRIGIEKIIVLHFTQDLADLSPEEFLETMQRSIHCQKLFMGEDFTIGKNKRGNAETLSKLGKIYGFSTEVIPKDTSEGSVISSTRIRKLLLDGKVEDANRLLGYPFFFVGKIIHGDARGRKLGFPTLNVRIPEGKLQLPNGVYAVKNTIDGICYNSVTNIGVRPTFGLEDKGVFVESFLLDVTGDFYGEESRLEFLQMLRPEIRFENADALREQVSRDIKRAKLIFA